MTLLQTLSLKQVEVASDFYYHGMTQKAIAAKRGISRQAVVKLLSKARAHLTKLGTPEPQRYKPHHGRMRQIPEAFSRMI
jgi:DNA-directed RNA polymerase specialized sigma24 family protein